MAFLVTGRRLAQDFFLGFIFAFVWSMCVRRIGGNSQSRRNRFIMGSIVITFVIIYFERLGELVDPFIHFTCFAADKILKAIIIAPITFDGFSIFCGVLGSIVWQIGEENFRPRLKHFLVFMVLYAYIRTLVVICIFGEKVFWTPAETRSWTDHDRMIANISCTEFCKEVVTATHNDLVKLNEKEGYGLEIPPLSDTYLESYCAHECIENKESLGDEEFTRLHLSLYKPGRADRKRQERKFTPED